MAAGCLTSSGRTLCTSRDVQAWAQALQEQEAAIDLLLMSQAPGAADQARIAAMVEQSDIARTSQMSTARSQVMAYARAVDLSHCVTSLWEGRGNVSQAKTNGTKNGKTKSAVPDTLKKPLHSTLVLVAVGLAAGLVGFVLRSARG